MSGPIVLATANAGKVTEIRAILQGVELLPRPQDVPDVDETADTLEGNARIKARALVDATGHAAIADDTGLEVDALDGAPGVKSARYVGNRATDQENVAKLLAALFEQPDEKRTARFRTVALLRFPDGREVMAEGSVEGTICREPKGDGGFGYDPVFVPNESSGLTFGQMSAEQKNRISHRFRAFQALRERAEL